MSKANKGESEQRKSPRIKAEFPIKIGDLFLGKTVDISEGGAKLILSKPLPSPIDQAAIQLGKDETIDTKIKVAWEKQENGRYIYGLTFTEIEEQKKEKLQGTVWDKVEELNKEEFEEFLNTSLPDHIVENYKRKHIFDKVNQRQMMKCIDFEPPFLIINKMIVFGGEPGSVVQSKSLAVGVITPENTVGHYNNTIFLAMCGWLMASSASVHLAVLFPETAPQVIEANGVKPLLTGGDVLWKPSAKGTPFFAETTILKKKLQLVIAETKISFSDIQFGMIKELKLILTQKESIWEAKELPER